MTPMLETSAPPPSGLPLNRIEAFSDGVIAILITILVLEFKVPDLHGVSDLREALKLALSAGIPKVISYMISFLVLTVWWVAHHHLFHLLRYADRITLWLNALFLMFLSLIPFPTGLMGEYPHEPLTAIIYGTVCFLCGFTFFLLRRYVSHRPSLLKQGVSEEILSRNLRRSLISPVAYFAATCISAKWPVCGVTLFALIPLYYVVPGILTKENR